MPNSSARELSKEIVKEWPLMIHAAVVGPIFPALLVSQLTFGANGADHLSIARFNFAVLGTVWQKLPTSSARAERIRVVRFVIHDQQGDICA